MLNIFKFFIMIMIIILLISAFCGVIAFFKDLHDFKSEKQMSLPRRKLIQAILDEQELKVNFQNNDEKDGAEKCSTT